MPKREPRPETITTEVEGQTYRGTYTVSGNMVKVRYGVLWDETHVSPGTEAEGMAAMLLAELVHKSKAGK
jgi:hypothetical protein